MTEIGVRELNQQTSKVLRRVRAGEDIVITEHGRPVARLVPVTDEPKSVLQQLREQGLVIDAEPNVEPIERIRLDISSQELLDEIRADKV